MALKNKKNKLMAQFTPLGNFFSNRLFRFVVVLAFCGFVAAPVHAAVPDAEREALVALYNDMDGPNWTGIISGWPNGDPCDDAWTGITCNSERTSITKVLLERRKLAGPIPSAMGDLENLVELDLSYNLMTGEIPQELGNLSKLEVLYLRNLSATVENSISGGIPASLGQLTNLKTLRLQEINLSGSIPQEIWGLTNLEMLRITNRMDNPGLITGELPPQVGQLVNLTQIWILRTGITGEIPAEIGLLKKLDRLSLYDNELTGNIPTTLGQLSELKWLTLYGNRLVGGIPETLSGLRKLEGIYLQDNQLSGEFPEILENWTDLRTIALSNNEFSGPLPTKWGEKPRLGEIHLSGNHFSGFIPEGMGNYPLLRWLDLHDNQLTGSIPENLKNLTGMNVFVVANNRLTGPIPSWMENWRQAVRLEIQGNQFVGEIPESLRFLTDLKTAGFSNFSWNGLWTNNPDLKDMLEQATEGDWSATQTVAPSNIKIISSDGANVELAWDGVEFGAPGRFQVWYATESGGPWLDGGVTADKSALSHTVEGLLPGTEYFFKLQTETDSHTNNTNQVVSEPSPVVSAITTGEAPAFFINAGLNDAWYNPATDGQGFFITVFRDIGVVVLAWFTYDTELPPGDAIANLGDAGHRWLLAVGPFLNNEAILDIEIASGGVFDTESEITRVMDGSIKLTFDDCNAGLVEYNIRSIGREGSVPIQRVAKDNIVLCEILNEELHNNQ